MALQITYDQFVEKFKPIPNHIVDDAPYDGYQYETYGVEFRYVLSQPTDKIWTIVQCDGDFNIISGLHLVNREGFIITEVGHPADQNVEVLDWASGDSFD